MYQKYGRAMQRTPFFDIASRLASVFQAKARLRRHLLMLAIKASKRWHCGQLFCKSSGLVVFRGCSGKPLHS